MLSAHDCYQKWLTSPDIKKLPILEAIEDSSRDFFFRIEVALDHVLSRPHVWQDLVARVGTSLKEAGMFFPLRWWLLRFYWKQLLSFQEGVCLIEIENNIRSVMNRFPTMKRLKRKNGIKRARQNLQKIKDFIVGDKILDLGGGNGILGELIVKEMKKEVILVDVVDTNLSDLPLYRYEQGEDVPLDDVSVDSTILYVVLHHAMDPDHLVKEACRVTRHRVIVVEGYHENDADTVAFNGVLDWIYNRCLQNADIDVPLNYRPIERWKSSFAREGFTLIDHHDLGIDEVLVPEHHVRLVFERERS